MSRKHIRAAKPIAFDMSSIRRDFPALHQLVRGKPLIYLDNAATSWPKPEKVYQFMVDFYRSCGVNPGRSGFDMAIDSVYEAKL